MSRETRPTKPSGPSAAKKGTGSDVGAGSPSSEPSPRARATPSQAAPAGKIKPRGRPRGPFTQARRLETLRALLVRHPKGLTIYQLGRELGITPRSLRRYLIEVRREIDIVSVTPR